MKNTFSLGSSRYWWLLLILGILLVIGGFAYWFWPVAGFAVASVLFGWLLVGVGIVQLCVAAGRSHPTDWGWWLAGGVINILVGFMLVANVFLAEQVLPFFLAFVFLYAGVMTFARACTWHGDGGRWLYFINGILLFLVGLTFLLGGFWKQMTLVTFLAALAFIYWGFTLSGIAFDLKPQRSQQANQ